MVQDFMTKMYIIQTLIVLDLMTNMFIIQTLIVLSHTALVRSLSHTASLRSLIDRIVTHGFASLAIQAGSI